MVAPAPRSGDAVAMVRRSFIAVTVAALVVTAGIAGTARAATGTTAWRAGTFSVNVPNLVRRSDIVLGSPNAKPEQAMPLGNGVLGATVWAAGGFTAQLNRSDTRPLRLSHGRLTIPGLAKLTGAADFSAHPDHRPPARSPVGVTCRCTQWTVGPYGPAVHGHRAARLRRRLCPKRTPELVAPLYLYDAAAVPARGQPWSG